MWLIFFFLVLIVRQHHASICCTVVLETDSRPKIGSVTCTIQPNKWTMKKGTVKFPIITILHGYQLTMMPYKCDLSRSLFISQETSMKVMLEKGCTNISSHLIFILKKINWCYQLLTVTLIIRYFKSSQYLNIFIILHYKCHISGLSSLVKYMWPTVCRMNY